ncbi:MAG: Asp-tRNA(Asn)/Glu-tRNA(Gln) amidotransferase subunit GatA [Candidatus Microgenomates bacterium]
MKYNQLSIIDARELLKKNETTSLNLTQNCLKAISTLEPKLNAFISVFNAEAEAAAKIADKNLKSGLWTYESHPLAGIPIALKDNFATAGLKTTAGSKVLDTFYPPYDSTVVKRLKDAGAIIIGKTNMDAWAHGSSTETSDYGSTKNPYDVGRLAGGSSGGSAAAVASHEVIAAIGSETAGSIRQPASWCGVVGMKPTYGRVSRYGVVAMGSSLDSPGPMTKTVADSALLLSVIAGLDPKDATTSPNPVPNYLKELSKISLKGLKIGIPKEYLLKDAQPGINEQILKASKQIERLGAELIEISLLDPKYSIADYTIIQRAEVSSNLARYTGIRYGAGRELLGTEAKRRIMLGTYALSSGYYDAYYKKGEAVRQLLKDDFSRVFKIVDIILAPTAPTTALPIGATEDSAMFGELADVLVEASSLAGLTGINIPVGFVGKLPVGMQLIGRHFDETTVLAVAHAYEQSVNWRKNH